MSERCKPEAQALVEEAALHTEVEFLGYLPLQVVGADIAFLQRLDLR